MPEIHSFRPHEIFATKINSSPIVAIRNLKMTSTKEGATFFIIIEYLSKTSKAEVGSFHEKGLACNGINFMHHKTIVLGSLRYS